MRPDRNVRRRLTAAEKSQALRLHREGLDFKQIARALCRSDRAVAAVVIADDLAAEEALDDDAPLVQVRPFGPPRPPGGYSAPWAGDVGRLPVRLPRVVRLAPAGPGESRHAH